MTGDELRGAFLSYFEGQGHLRLPSSSLVPQGDPTLLLTSAGMVQFKPYFLGEATPPHRRLTTCQKCFRTTDIDSVGDASHLTFFEMLGNFSVGDYFKAEAIRFAWEFITKQLGLPSERLWATIFLDDDESFDLWRGIGVPKERIARFGEEDNFWGPAGESGPCGPCSELHYELRTEPCQLGDRCRPNCECGRFLEIWNLVFMQYFQDAEGRRTPLAMKNVDTGLGLERVAAVLQGVGSVYETDLFLPLIRRAEDLTGHRYGESEPADRGLRVLAEHARAVTFLVGDGVLPSNEGRGYVLRRVLRRAVRFGRTLGREEPFLKTMAQAVIERMAHVYPELKEKQGFILRVIELEESRFEQTLTVGLNLLDDIVAQVNAEGGGTIPGTEVFRLYDTYGFPAEVTAEVAAEQGLSIDWEGFEAKMAAQRERARAAARFGLGEKEALAVYQQLPIEETRFLGYDTLSARSTVVGLIREGEARESAEAGQKVEIVLLETPFYGEAGGQVGDTGEIRGPAGKVIVKDTVRPLPDLIVHQGHVVEGSISSGEEVEAKVDAPRRMDIARNHTATHLLQAALRQVLGSHVRQSGSLVAPERLRFDFSHLAALTADEIAQIESIVNEKVRENLPVHTSITTYNEAMAQGAIALFDERYGDEVRLVQVGPPEHPFSAELCGGTHLRATGEIGFFHIVSESSIGAGLRRIEAVTGRGTEAYFRERLALIDSLSRQLHTIPSELEAKLASLLAERDEERRRAQRLERELARQMVEALLAQVDSVNGTKVVAAKVSASSMEALRQMGDQLRNRLGSGVVVLGAIFNNRPNFLAMVTQDLVERGFHAGEMVKEVAAVTGGGGGGRPQMGQAGGRDKGKVDEALRLVKQLVADRAARGG